MKIYLIAIPIIISSININCKKMNCSSVENNMQTDLKAFFSTPDNANVIQDNTVYSESCAWPRTYHWYIYRNNVPVAFTFPVSDHFTWSWSGNPGDLSDYGIWALESPTGMTTLTVWLFHDCFFYRNISEIIEYLDYRTGVPTAPTDVIEIGLRTFCNGQPLSQSRRRIQ